MIDVAILGGGLAGLTLARELVLARPGTSITVFESTVHPPPIAGHKVGESSVEIAGHWFVNVLGLGEHFAKEQLPKLGLRFFWGQGPVEDRIELGPIANKVPVPFEGLLLPSYQIDRGVLERFMAEDLERLGVKFSDRTKVKDVTLDAANGHTVVIERDGERSELKARYVLDATGRASLLKKRTQSRRISPHGSQAAWFRVKGHIKVDDWAPAAAWRVTMQEPVRWRSTVHFMGRGYWVWLIPLPTDHMSIGIVAGSEDHDFADLANFQRAMGWMDRHQPLVADKIREHLGDDEPVDFLALKRYALDADRVYTSEGWGLTGNAGAFIDPLYSPGSDFIATVNRGQVDLAVRFLDGEDITERAVRMESWFRVLYDMFLRVYQDKYPLFGNPQVMSAKVLFDTAFYWAWPTLLYRNDALMDLDYIDSLGDLVPRMIDVQKNAQRFFLEWHARGERACAGSIDQFDVATTWRIYVSLIRQVNHERLTQRLESNLATIEAMLEVLFRHAARDIPEVAAAERIDITKLTFDRDRFEEVGLFDGPDRAEEVARVSRELEALWIDDAPELRAVRPASGEATASL